jgi:ATP-dependent Clp protease protease subunit
MGDPVWPDAFRYRMLESRAVFLTGELDDESATRAATELMTLDATGDDAVQLFVNGAGGSLDNALMLIDVVDLLGVPVHATCIGRAEGPVIGVFAVAARRSAARHARFRLMLPSDSFVGTADVLAAWSAQRDADVARFAARLADSVRMSAPAITEALQTGRYFDAPEAIGLGFVDELARSRTIRPAGARPIGFRSRRAPLR